MKQLLKLTRKEVEQLTGGETFNDHFEISHNDIPLPVPGEKWHSSMYIEDDGRQYRNIEFVDTKTNISYDIPYTYNPEVENSYFDSDLEHAGILIVDQSVINPVIKEPVKTEEEKQVQNLWEHYNSLSDELSAFDKNRVDIPYSVIEDIINFLNTKSFSKNELLLKVLPVCIKYRLEQKSFWQGIQKMRGVFK